MITPRELARLTVITTEGESGNFVATSLPKPSHDAIWGPNGSYTKALRECRRS